MQEKICQNCGKTFKKKGNSKFCSHKCYSENKKKGTIKICPECGKEFYTTPSFPKKYCCHECYTKSNIKLVERTCPQCNKSFMDRTIQSKTYCNKECYKKFKKENRKRICPTCGKEFFGFKTYCSRKCYWVDKDKKIVKTCPVCNKEFRSRESLHQKFCSLKCSTTLENNNSWKGGVSFEPYCFKFNEEFRSRVRAFFNHTCLLCGKPQSENKYKTEKKAGKVQKLNVHHVHYRKDACCSEDAPRYFAPLCLECHRKTNDNREYWEDYFENLIDTKFGGKCYFTKEEMSSQG